MPGLLTRPYSSHRCEPPLCLGLEVDSTRVGAWPFSSRVELPRHRHPKSHSRPRKTRACSSSAGAWVEHSSQAYLVWSSPGSFPCLSRPVHGAIVDCLRGSFPFQLSRCSLWILAEKESPVLLPRAFRLLTVSQSWTPFATEMGSTGGFSWAHRQLRPFRGHGKLMRLTRLLGERMRRVWTPESQLRWQAAGRKTTQGLRKTSTVS